METRTTEHARHWSTNKSIMVLLGATLAVAFMSEMLVGVIEHVAEAAHLSEFFIGVILIPLIGNAAEHLTAVTVAGKDKMDLALNIAVGSSTQIALFVAPLLVFISLFLGHPMLLIFNELEVVAVTVSVFILDNIVRDGESHWMEGVLLDRQLSDHRYRLLLHEVTPQHFSKLPRFIFE